MLKSVMPNKGVINFINIKKAKGKLWKPPLPLS